MGIMFDNQAWYKYAKDFLGLKKSSYRDVNSIIAKLYSDLTAGFRYSSERDGKSQPYFYFSNMVEELVPQKLLISLYSTMIPLKKWMKRNQPLKQIAVIDKRMMNKDVKNEYAEDIKEEIKINEKEEKLNTDQEWYDVASGFQVKNQLLSMDPIDKYSIGTHTTLRGHSVEHDKVYSDIRDLILMKKEHSQISIHDSQDQTDHMLTLSNNGAISSVFSMVEYRFNKMFSRRQFVPNFTDSLISEMDMVEARETVEMMIEEYTTNENDKDRKSMNNTQDLANEED